MIDNIAFNKDLPFSIFSFLHWDERGRERLSVLVKGHFKPDQNGRLRAVPDKPEILFNDVFSGALNESSLERESDIAPFKPKTDISFNAIARSPEAKNLASWPVRIDVDGRVSYAFHAAGARFFEPQKNGHKGSKYWRMSDMEKTVAVPLDYEHSFGGTVQISDEEVKTHPYNPVGTGLLSNYLLEKEVRIAVPQIGILAELNDPKPDQEMTVCGIAPLVKSWLPRRAFAGKFDEQWLTSRQPQMPEDFDFNYWNAAPLPLQLTPYLRGDETLRLSGLWHAPHPVNLVLPGAGIGARVRRTGSSEAELLSLRLDTVHGDVRCEKIEEHLFTLIWRATFDNPDEIDEIILHPAALSRDQSIAENEQQAATSHVRQENEEARDILQNRQKKIAASLDANPEANAILSVMTAGMTPLLAVTLANGKQADFYIRPDDNRVLITRQGTSEILHIGNHDFIYAQLNAPQSPENPSHAPQKIDERVTLYVRLLDENVLVWRPVVAYWHGGTRFYIALQPVPKGEVWEFRPDTRVIAEWQHFNGENYLVAVKSSNH